MNETPNTIYEIREGLKETGEKTKRNDVILKKDVLPYVKAVRYWAIVAAVGAFLGGLSAVVELSLHIYDRCHGRHQVSYRIESNEELPPERDDVSTITMNTIRSKTNGVDNAK